MYVCICHSVTDRDIRRAVARGADSVGALQRELKVSTGCGCCAESVEHFLALARDECAPAGTGYAPSAAQPPQRG